MLTRSARRLRRLLPGRPQRAQRVSVPRAVWLVAGAALGWVLGGPVAAIVAIAYGGLAAYLVRRVKGRAVDRIRLERSLDALSDAAAAVRSGAVEPDLSGVDEDVVAAHVRAAQVLSQRSGAPVAALLDRIEAQHRAMAQTLDRVRAESAGVVTTAIVLAALPLGGLALGSTLGADPLGVLLGTAFGGVCAVGAIALQIAGVAWVIRLQPRGATPSRSAGPLDSRAGRIASAAAGGALLALLIGGVAGIVIGIAAAVTVRWALGRREPAATRLAREQAQADLPLAVELLAAALRAGAPVDHALLAVAEALPGSLADRLTRTGRAMRLGATTADATRHLADLTGAGRLITAMERSSASGAALAEVLTRTASDLRQAHQLRLEASARRAAVLLVLPLGFCFLPAFVLAGLVPVLLAMLGDSTI